MEDRRAAYIRGVRVPDDEQRQGHGTRLLRALCVEADAGGWVLVLEPAEQWHEAWYGRFGFRRIQSEPVVLLMRSARRQSWDANGSPVEGDDGRA